MKPHAPLLLSAAALGLVAAVNLTGQEAGPAPAAPAKPAPHVTLFSNVRIFDGKSDTLSAHSNVLVRGNLIEKISADPIPTDRRGDTVLNQLAKKYKIKTAFGTDMLFSPANVVTQGKQLTRLKKWYSNAEILIMVTSQNAELLTLSGPRNPYPGKLGVVEEGTYADLLLVDGNPLENLDLVADPDRNFTVIMKDGTIYKNAR